MPFLVAFIISLMVEPAIKFIMRKTNLTRRTSSIIIFVIVSLIILGTLTWLIITLFSESSSLLQGLNNYFDKAYIQFQSLISTFNYDTTTKEECSRALISPYHIHTTRFLQLKLQYVTFFGRHDRIRIEMCVVDLSFTLKASVRSGTSVLCVLLLCFPC